MFLSFGSVLVASLSRDGWNRMKKGDFESPLCTHSLWQDRKVSGTKGWRKKAPEEPRGEILRVRNFIENADFVIHE